MHPHRTTPSVPALRRLGPLALAGVLLLGACGSDDDEPAEEPAASEPANGGMDDASTDSADGSSIDPDIDIDEDALAAGGAEAGGEVRDVLTDALGDEGGDLSDAISTLSPETRFGTVASQLDPEPEIVVEGGTIQLVFPSGSTGDSTMSCIIAGAFVEPEETLLLVYPDGEVEC